MESQSIDDLAVNTIRTLSMDAVQKANSGHPGAPMGLAPVGYVLFSRIMRHNPADPLWANRDRFVLSAGHACMLQYSLLHLCGYDLGLDDIKQFRQLHSRCPGHPEIGVTPGVEISTGPLGQGFANSVGFALAEAVMAERFNRDGHTVVDHNTWMICSDGDMQEGISSEAASLAGSLGLGKLIAIYDDNGISIEGPTDIAFRERVGDRFRAYDWSVRELEINPSLEQLELSLQEAREETERPSLIVLPTHIGFGSPNKQDSGSAHGSPLGDDEVELTKRALGWPYEEPFTVPDEVRELFAKVPERGAEAQRQWSEAFERYAADHAELADELERMNRREPPKLPERSELPSLGTDDGPIATRAASGQALNWLAPRVPSLIGGSADLAPSNSTHMEDLGSIGHHHFGARNLHFGIREHAMGAVVNGLTVSGFRAFGATFLVFHDYMRAAVRLAALMEVPSTFVYTHDSFWVGEDGPTHQPIEHLAALRAMPNLQVIRPADANETMLAWHWTLGHGSGPVAMALTRQKLPVLDRSRIPDDAIERGAYVYTETASDREPEIIVIASGSEVSICVEAAEALGEEDVAIRVVSMPSSTLFAAQPRSYRDEVLPPSIGCRLSVEAAVSFGWERWIGERGESIAIDHFGASAPGGELAEEFGFTADDVGARIRSMIGAQADD